MAEATIPSASYISFLQGAKGSKLDISKEVQEHPETVAQSVAYVISENSYHRGNLCEALLALINGPHAGYRNNGWALLQRVPFSHLLEILDIVQTKKGAKKHLDNSRRLRYAMAVKIANTKKEDVARAYFMFPEKFRGIFDRLYLPREKCDDRVITHEVYKMAYKLSTLGVPDAMKELSVGPADMVKKLHVPLENVMQHVQDPGDAEKLAKIASPDNFIDHARWFRNILGDEAYSKLMDKKVELVKDPMRFLGIKKHLEETGALTPAISKAMEARADEIMNEMLSKYNIKHLAMLVDTSGSMEKAVEITRKLLEGFSRLTVDHLIGFNNNAFPLTKERLTQLKCDGWTSIGSAVVLLAQRVAKKPDTKPEAILIISDMEENIQPNLEESLGLLADLGKPPIVVLHVKDPKGGIQIKSYPSAVIEAREFHPSLLKSIMEQTIKLTAKVAIEERKITEVVGKRDIQKEAIGAVEVPSRDPATLKSKYLPNLLCS